MLKRIFLISFLLLPTNWAMAEQKTLSFSSSSFEAVQNSSKVQTTDKWFITPSKVSYDKSFLKARLKLQYIQMLEEAEEAANDKVDEWHQNEMTWAQDSRDWSEDELEENYCP